jgi:hypothetical protein
LFDLDFDKGNRVVGTIHDVVFDPRITHVGLASAKRDIVHPGPTMDTQRSIDQHNDEVEPLVLVLCGHRWRGEAVRAVQAIGFHSRIGANTFRTQLCT